MLSVSVQGAARGAGILGEVPPSPELLGRLDPSTSPYLQALRERVVIFDGAMGTNLQLLGLADEDFGGPEYEGCNEILVETKPELVAQVHRSFYEVGCDVVETDTFGSTSVVLAEYGLAARATSSTRTGAELACAVRDEFATPERPRWVAGSMGRAPSSRRSGRSPTRPSATPSRSRPSGCSKEGSTSS